MYAVFNLWWVDQEITSEVEEHLCEGNFLLYCSKHFINIDSLNTHGSPCSGSSTIPILWVGNRSEVDSLAHGHITGKRARDLNPGNLASEPTLLVFSK